MTRPNPNTIAPRAFFGRRAGKRLHRAQSARLAERLPDLEIELGEGQLDLDGLFPSKVAKIIEIGYGGGEHLARLAGENPIAGFIGCEVFTGGIGKMVEAIARENLQNIRLYSNDALKLLEKLPAGGLDAAYLLYPDPWPKTRHHKRRFIGPHTLSALARALKRDAPFYFATDIEDYANWALAHILRNPEFVLRPTVPGAWHRPFPGWQPTRYEQKARREGRDKSFYFTFWRS